jgi:Spy/CpxP family protein refolding chaperone
MVGRSIQAKLLVFAVFFLGIASGVLIANFYTTRVSSTPDLNRPAPPQQAQRDINKFYDFLGLTKDQREQMHQIGEETQQEFRDLRMETQPRYQAIQEQSREKIRAILSDEQRTKYDEWRRQRDEERRKRAEEFNRNGRVPNAERGPRP